MNTIELIKQRINLEIENPQTQICLSLHQGETAKALIFSLFCRGCEYVPPQSCRAVFTALKADGKVIYNPCSIEGKQIIYPISPQTTAAPGLLSCQLRLYDHEEKLLLSPRFKIHVEQAVYQDGMVLESENEVGALTALISDSTELIDKIRQELSEGAYIPKLKIGTVSTLPAGSLATAEFTGTASEPVLNLGIPQGQQGTNEELIPDLELSENSLRPVQNRVLTAALAQKVDKTEFELSIANFVEKEVFSETVSNFVELEEFGNKLSEKQNREEGKGLSQNDFTDACRDKLESLENFVLLDGAVSPEKLSADAKSRAASVTLAAANWADKAQTVSVSAVTANNNVIVSPAPNSAESYADAEIKCISQAEGSLTFSCADLPSGDVAVNVIILV